MSLFYYNALDTTIKSSTSFVLKFPERCVLEIKSWCPDILVGSDSRHLKSKSPRLKGKKTTELLKKRLITSVLPRNFWRSRGWAWSVGEVEKEIRNREKETYKKYKRNKK